MASIKKIAGVIAAIKTIYPYYSKDGDVRILTQTWAALLKEYSDDDVEKALHKCLQICKQPPTPADMIEQIKFIHEASEPSETNLWSIFVQAYKDTAKYIYRLSYPMFGEDPRAKLEEVWQSLPGEIKRYVGSKSELMRMAKTYTEQDLSFEKTRFLKSMPAMREREEYMQLSITASEGGLFIGVEES